ncbi:MAG: hypothetical protein PHI72_05705 [Atribacterota bacterium]|nr:hypothetical protein [Atribacterota bacterium]MDD4895157.1 hypothetical protein [Atribacterota bacterium]MDD5637194.1 hypothetical protein [Atribacterota bacterium]
MRYGNWGRIVEIDINKKISKVLELSEDIYNKFLGGRGLGVYLLDYVMSTVWILFPWVE